MTNLTELFIKYRETNNEEYFNTFNFHLKNIIKFKTKLIMLKIKNYQDFDDIYNDMIIQLIINKNKFDPKISNIFNFCYTIFINRIKNLQKKKSNIYESYIEY